MTELDIGVRWAPNVPEAVLASDDYAVTVVALNAHFLDPDQRAVLLRWQLCAAVIDGPFNDEAIHLHSLYRAGLADVRWIGEVHDSEWLDAIDPAPDPAVTPDLRHFIVLTKERAIEVAASELEVLRCEGSTREAAFAALGRQQP